MVSGVPFICIMTTGAPLAAAAFMASSPCNASTSFMIAAPAAVARFITAAWRVSTEMSKSARANAVIGGKMRANS